MIRRFRSWARAMLRRDAVQREIDEELRAHLEREIEALVASGLTPAEAHRRAHAEFGSVAALREECREARGTYLFESAVQDLRYGLRLLRRSPAFTLTAVTTLALTIGAVCTVLTLAHTLFLQTLPVPRAAEVVELRPTRDQGTRTGFVSYPDYVHFRDSTRAVHDLAAVYPSAPLFVTSADEARAVNGAVVSANFFPMLELEPVLGRFFTPEEDTVPERDPVVVIGFDFWRTWFGQDPEAIGASLKINTVPFTVIGVAPPEFHGTGTQPTRIYMPTMMLPVGYRWCSVLEERGCTILKMFGRLADGVSIEAASAEAATLIPTDWHGAGPGRNSGALVVPTYGTNPSPSDRQFVQLLALVVGVLFLVCCVNLAGLLIARAKVRTRELALRSSLGAPRVRLLRQLLTESVLLACTGGALGVAVSAALTRLLSARFYSTDAVGRPLQFDFTLTPTVVLATACLTILAGVIFGILPALGSIRGDAAAGLRGHNRAVTSRGGAAAWLLGAQAAAAVTLVLIAALLAGSAASMIRGANFDPSHVALMRLRPRMIEYSPPRAQAFLKDVTARLEALPSVESVTMVGTGIALYGLGNQVSPAGSEASHEVGYIEVGPRYFETLRTPLRSGREFTPADDTSAPLVAVVSEALATLLFPGSSAIGEAVRVADREHRIVGVVADVPLQNRAEPPRPYLYVPFWQNPDQVDARLQIRVAGDPAAMLPTLARTVSEVDANVPVTGLVPMPLRIAGNLRPLRMGATAVGYAGGLAVLLSAIGLYATLAAKVAQRTREIGVRLALGSTSRQIVGLIINEGMRVIVVGVAAGLALAVGCARLLQHLLYGSSQGDLLAYFAASLLIAAVGLLACWFPARWAARTQPMQALRLE